jgi:hypothetical protein
MPPADMRWLAIGTPIRQSASQGVNLQSPQIFTASAGPVGDVGAPTDRHPLEAEPSASVSH